MKRRRTKTSSTSDILEALTHLDWKELKIHEAFYLFAALEEAHRNGGAVIQEIARKLVRLEQQLAPPEIPGATHSGPRSGMMNGQLDHTTQAARLCSACGVAPLNAEMFGPWLMSGLCQNCFDTQ